ncbi:23S rRNA (uracil(1939)-C(5))-methyltransferase RlmD [Kouleothrix sp.]|uniref:23S rRNA (uracil(1939)-C(5))-methyltransferase RlmD n=1 Tax=Kouleothrix sp. TaxID=2779161 RepID=UPI00391CFE42
MTTTSWPETLELTFDGIAQGGEAVGRFNERVVFAAGGLPGERALVRLHELRDSYARGSVAEVLSPSPERVAPRMPGADHMPWQHIAYPAQLRFKRQIVAEQLAKIGGITEAPVAETLAPGPPWNYRNSARLHGHGQQIGYYIANTRNLHAIDEDPLLLPVLNQALADLSAVAQATGAPTEIVLRASETHGYALAALRGAPDWAATRWRARCPALAGVTLLADSRVAATFGASQLIEELGGVAFQLRPATFFQVSLPAANALLDLARASLGLSGAERLLDLYCGAGAFTLPLAAQAREVVGIEEFGGAIEDGRASAALNGIANVHFLAGRVEAVLPRVEGPVDAVLLDPPRRGCHPQAIAYLLELAPARIVYISCQPATLARDLKALVEGGYHVESVQPVDLFPQTAHIECVTTLTRG